jgi:hypothetical protein
MRLFEKGGVAPKHRAHQTRSPVGDAPLEQIGLEEAADRTGEKAPGTRPLSLLVEVLRTPEGEPVHLVQLVLEVAIGNMEQGSAEPANIG